MFPFKMRGFCTQRQMESYAKLNSRKKSLSFLKSYGVPPMRAWPSSSQFAQFRKTRVLNDVRFDRKEHYLVETKDHKRRNCVGEDSKRRLSANAASAMLVFA